MLPNLINKLLDKNYYSLDGSNKQSIPISKDERMTYIIPIRKYIFDKKETIKANHLNGASGVTTTQALTNLVDNVITDVFITSAEFYKTHNGIFYPSCSIVAVGGYGRGELNPFSDIDILFLYKNRIDKFIEETAKIVVSLLWDIGFEVGHSVRSVDNCMRIAKSDITAKTSMSEARFITGNIEIFKQFTNKFRQTAAKSDIKNFIDKKILERTNNSLNFETIYLTEPNVKEGIGGLRDFHTAIWISFIRFNVSNVLSLLRRGIVDFEDARRIQESFDFLLKIRNCLHFISDKKNDLLTFNDQKIIAKTLNYKPEKRFSDVELLMHDYFAHATNIKTFSEDVIKRCKNYGRKKTPLKQFIYKKIGDGLFSHKNELCIKTFNPTIFENNPPLIFKVFLYCQENNLKLSERLKELLKSSLHKIDDSFIRSKKISSIFFTILKNKNSSNTIRTMHKLGILGRYIKEFSELTYLIQNDFYHRYTIDEHTLRAMEAYENLDTVETDQNRKLKQMYHNIAKPEIVKIAILLHDIAKGKGLGEGHAIESAILADRIMKSLKIPDDINKEVCLLIKNHLLMSLTAQRRDIKDTKTIIEFTKEVGNTEALKMLYLLTYSDIWAVGKNTWSAWKQRLLNELYNKSINYLNRNETETMSDVRLMSILKADIIEELSNEIDEEEINKYFKAMPDKYILSITKKTILNHIKLSKELKNKKVAIKLINHKDKDFTEIIICTMGITGLLSKIAGTLTSKNLNILRTKAYTRLDGIAIDTIHARSQYSSLDMDPEVWKRIERDLLSVIEGTKDVETLLKNARFKTGQSIKKDITIKPEVIIDNNISDTHTVIETHNEDRVGILYSITNQLYKLDVDIYLAKVNIETNTGVNVFYVTDLNGSKITDKDKLKSIRTKLLHILLHE